MAGTVPNLETYIKSGFNILLSGLHGTGKTQSIQAACESLGLKVKYYSASTLDPYTDLVGVPVPRTDADGKETLKMVRPREIDEAEVVIFDELNRAEAKTRNAVMELVQFRAINGEKLPNLKCVVAAVNPPSGDYDVEELDPALIDRFHVMLEVKPRVSASYFKKVLGERYALALINWWNGHNQSKRSAYLSPRRLELLGEVWAATKSVEALRAALPPEGVFEVTKLAAALREADMTPAELKAAAEARKKAAEAAEKAEEARRSAVASWTTKEIRDLKNVAVVAGALKASPTDVNLHNYVADSFRGNVGVSRLFEGAYLPIMEALSESALSAMAQTWSGSKISQARTSLYLMLQSKHHKSKKADVQQRYGHIGRALKGKNGNLSDIVTEHIARYRLA